MSDIENNEPLDLQKPRASTSDSSFRSSWKILVFAVGAVSVLSLVLSLSLPLALWDDNSSTSSTSTRSSPKSLEEAARLGVMTFQKEADLLCSKVQLLNSVIGMGDLEEARKVYSISRAFYEQIEVLAESFEVIDCNIDCRAYSFEHGDGSADYFGFHRIESHLFRDSNTTLALPYAEKLRLDCLSLQEALADVVDSGEVSPLPIWEGILGLATEIAAKKVSQDESS
jgi:iron uptake system EfeUOB component EfeO/EfeM